VTATLTKLDLSSLTDDGDTLTLDDGRVLRLKIECDQDATINDFGDCYGISGYVENGRRNDYGYYPRPEGFTGNSEKLWWGNDGPWWWEPPTDVKRSDPVFKSLRDSVRELLEFGFKGVVLELCEGKDYYGKQIVINSASLWGCDSVDAPYLQEIVRELADEMEVN